MFRSIVYMLITAMLAAGCGALGSVNPTPTSELRGAVFEPPRALTDFTIPSTSGAPFTLSENKGQVILLYFGYLTCPDICPTTMAELQNIYLHLNKPADQLKVVFVTVDPDRDTLDRLTSYTHAFDADFIGVRADDADTLRQVMQQFGATAARRQVGDSPLSYTMDHTASIFLIGPDQQLLAQYLYGTDYHDILNDVQTILQSA